ncbi:hypothetical protein NDU88_008875 [Pleurodeles waltl]|uniref:Uncharacterized protein n=1 Tax=Pleurodeles waltl TaxID=8319 RepID=A0AAV7NXA6_PLEWA|nr:hypothetical protein NDU88_008875 [Pleurodeles waltl]
MRGGPTFGTGHIPSGETRHTRGNVWLLSSDWIRVPEPWGHATDCHAVSSSSCGERLSCTSVHSHVSCMRPLLR